MSDKEFDAPEEPSVDSADPTERKLARRLRIQRRLEALKKHESSEDEGIAETTKTEKQIETSAELLEKLIAEGDEVITNVRVANDAREVHRREDDVAIRNALLKKLEEEANDSVIKYRSINEKWSGILTSKDPLDIHAGIQSQNLKCMEILEQKDRIIAELKQELENADEKFTIDEKKQCEDINLLIERIDNQVNTIAKAYRRELVLIEEALNSERKSLLESIDKRWDTLYKQRREEDTNGVERRQDIMREYEIEMKRVMVAHQEEYRAQKIELETECQNLQQEVERMKAVCMMNVEKLDYSYAVLKRREDENTIIKNQQKRRINKLQDVVNELRKSCTDLEEGSRSEIEKLSEQVTKAHKNISELEAKSNHFTIVNEKQYFDIWDMNTRNANDLLEKILTADRIIHEQTLGLDWKPPELALLRKEDLPSYRKTLSELQQKKAEDEAGMKIFESHKVPTTPGNQNLERLLLNNVLKRISDHSGFLIEDRLRELLIPRTFNDNIIIRLDNVFQALAIKSKEQIDILLNFFLPYSYCPTCREDDENCSIVSGMQREKSWSEEPASRNICPGSSKRREDSCDKEIGQEPFFKEICLGDTGSSEENSLPSNEEGTTRRNMESRITSAPERWSEDASLSAPRNVTCGKGHLLQIESANVTKALKEFVEKQAANGSTDVPSSHEKLTREHVTLSRSLTNEDVTNYWKRYREIFSTKKEKLWDGLLIGLDKYHDILKERHQLNNETECLRKQNEELRRLLETYMIKPDTNNLAPLGSRSLNKTA